jgi:hypothetical protein
MICDRPDLTLQAVLADQLRGIHHRPVVCASLFSPQLSLRVCIEGINDSLRGGFLILSQRGKAPFPFTARGTPKGFPFITLLPPLCLLITVTFSTPAGVYTSNPDPPFVRKSWGSSTRQFCRATSPGFNRLEHPSSERFRHRRL